METSYKCFEPISNEDLGTIVRQITYAIISYLEENDCEDMYEFAIAKMYSYIEDLQ